MATPNSRPIPTQAPNFSPRNSYISSSPVAAASIARDLEDCSDDSDKDDDDEDDESETSTIRAEGSSGNDHSMARSYRRPSFMATGPRPTVVPQFGPSDSQRLSKREREIAMKEERALLRDNHLLPPKERGSLAENIRRRLSSTPGLVDDPEAQNGDDGVPSETSPLIASQNGPPSRKDVSKKWEEAIKDGKIQTTWRREAKVISKYSAPLIITFLLQYSLTVASIFTVGHIGKIELGAVSLASMTANITGYAIYQGLATSLDTLCAQAYGSGKKKLVGLQMQRMIYFLWVLTVPIGILWLSAGPILNYIIPEPESARLAGLYLRILLIGAPGYACFESGKRFLQAQGLFSATLYILLILAPFNAFMNWLLVWVSDQFFILNSGFRPIMGQY
jgi:multidrug resistance protein, MATE family